MGPNTSGGKYDNAVMMMIMAKVNIPKVRESTFNVPEDSGIYFFFANNPMMAIGPMIGRNLPNNNTNPVVTFQKILLSPSPSKPLPLLADEEVNS